MSLPDVIIDSVGNKAQFAKFDIITLSHSGVLTDYQKLITVTWKSQMQNDFSDIRFSTQGGAYVPYIIESKTDGITANVWIKSDYISGDTTILMYYGNSSLSDGGVGGDVFLHYNDATSLTDWTGSGVSIFGGKLRFLDSTSSAQLAFYAHGETLPDDVITEIKANLTEFNDEDYVLFDVLDGAGTTDRFSQMVLAETPNNYQIPDTTQITSPLIQDEHKIHQMTLRKSATKVDYSVLDLDRTVRGSVIDKAYVLGSPSTYTHIGLFSGSGGRFCDVRFDWFIIRKHTATEPTYIIGEGNYNRVVTQFM